MIKGILSLAVLGVMLKSGGCQEQEKPFIVLDTSIDFVGGWKTGKQKETCLYGDLATDMAYGWGCGGPSEMGEGLSTARGFWSGCQISSCDLIFCDERFKSDTIIVKASIKGDASIRLLTKAKPESYHSVLVHTIRSGDKGYFEGEVKLDLSAFQHRQCFILNIVSSKSGHGYAFLDKVILESFVFDEKPGTGDGEPPSDRTNKISTPLNIIMVILVANLIKQLTNYA